MSTPPSYGGGPAAAQVGHDGTTGGGVVRHGSGDAGSATVHVLSLCTVLVLLSVVLVAAGSAAVARHRAGGAADSAALVAAARTLSGTAVACRAAETITAASSARLLSCRVVADRADVVVEVRPRGWLGRFGTARGRARAGPAGLAGLAGLGSPGAGTSG